MNDDEPELSEVELSAADREVWRPYRIAAHAYISAGVAALTPTREQLKVIRRERALSSRRSAEDRAERAGYHLRGPIGNGKRA